MIVTPDALIKGLFIALTAGVVCTVAEAALGLDYIYGLRPMVALGIGVAYLIWRGQQNGGLR